MRDWRRARRGLRTVSSQAQLDDEKQDQDGVDNGGDAFHRDGVFGVLFFWWMRLRMLFGVGERVLHEKHGCKGEERVSVRGSCTGNSM